MNQDKARVALIALAALALAGCGSGGGTTSPLGGWSGNGFYACFLDDGHAWFEDHPQRSAAPSCTWTGDGKVSCKDGSGTWSIEGDTLKIDLTTGCTGACSNAYSRDSSFTCP